MKYSKNKLNKYVRGGTLHHNCFRRNASKKEKKKKEEVEVKHLRIFCPNWGSLKETGEIWDLS